MKAVVTGATGFVGKWLVEELLRQGDEVTVIVRNSNSVPCNWKTQVHIVEASLEQLSHLTVNDFNMATADMFFHFAWAGTSGMDRADTEMQLANVQYACDAVRLASILNCKRFVNAGSIMEYEAMAYVPQDTTKPGMGYIYSIAKLTADCMAKTVATKEKIGYINVIISNIYGIGEKSARFLNTTMRKMLNNERIPLTHGEQLYDFIYVEDAVKAIILAGKEGIENSSYYIGNVDQKPLKEYIVEMRDVLKSVSELAFGEVPFVGPRLTYHEFSTRGLTELGFFPAVSFAEGIKLTKDWMVEVENEF